MFIYLAIDADGSEWAFDEPPIRDEESGTWVVDTSSCDGVYNLIRLPSGTIFGITGEEHSFSDLAAVKFQFDK